ncbi:MAG: ion transporter, partial [Bacteroidota bacterium]|nr:ion transporter [Bacteroidota bacterium]
MRSPILFDKFIYLLIIANVVAMIMESHVSIRNVYGSQFSIFEALSIYIFSFEYLYRIRLAYLDQRMKGVWKYIFSTFGLIDLISILPFYLNQF